ESGYLLFTISTNGLMPILHIIMKIRNRLLKKEMKNLQIGKAISFPTQNREFCFSPDMIIPLPSFHPTGASMYLQDSKSTDILWEEISAIPNYGVISGFTRRYGILFWPCGLWQVALILPMQADLFLWKTDFIQVAVSQ